MVCFFFCFLQRNRHRNCFATLSFTAQGRSSGIYVMIGLEPWNSELRNNSCVCYVVTRSTSPPGKYWAPSPAFIHWKSLLFCFLRFLVFNWSWKTNLSTSLYRRKIKHRNVHERFFFWRLLYRRFVENKAKIKSFFSLSKCKLWCLQCQPMVVWQGGNQSFFFGRKLAS